MGRCGWLGAGRKKQAEAPEGTGSHQCGLHLKVWLSVFSPESRSACCSKRTREQGSHLTAAHRTPGTSCHASRAATAEPTGQAATSTPSEIPLKASPLWRIGQTVYFLNCIRSADCEVKKHDPQVTLPLRKSGDTL